MASKKKDGDERQVTPESVRRRLRSLETLSLKLHEEGALTDKGREQLSRALVKVLEGAYDLDDRELFSRALAAIGPHITNSLFDLTDEEEWWDTWWKKTNWLGKQYRKCRRRFRTKRRRAACFANATAQAALCAGSGGAKAAVWLPLDVLAAAGLETTGVPEAFGMVPFFDSDDTLGVGDLNELVDTGYWTSVRKLRLKARAKIRRTTPQPGKIDSDIEAMFGKTHLGRTKISADLNRELLHDAVAEDERLLAERGARAWNTMRRMAIVQFEGATYFVSTLDPTEPSLVAEVPPNGGVIQASEGDAMDEAMFWVEVALETGMGLLTMLGVRFPGAGRKLGGWVKRLLRRINANRRLRRRLLRWIRKLGRVGFSSAMLWDLLCIFWDGIDMVFISEFIEDLADLGHWALLYFLGKLASKATPAGQILLIGDVAVLAIEVGAKIKKRTEQPRTDA